MLSATGSTGSLNGQDNFLCVVNIFFSTLWHSFCHPRVHCDRGMFHSHCERCDFSNSLSSAFVSGRFVPSGSSLTSLYG